MEVSSFTRLENEAQEKAAKYVANMLHTPDKLEKVHQMKWNVTRKKASVEAMLKTAMQSQLDGVKTGLGQLETALSEMKDIKTRFVNHWLSFHNQINGPTLYFLIFLVLMTLKSIFVIYQS